MKKTTDRFLIYGAYGYTGKLILELCKKQGIKPVIAGRNEDKLAILKKEYGFEYIAFSLDNVEKSAEILTPFKAVLHCAGPFMFTAEPMLKACLLSKTHYLDITGEISVFEMAAAMDKQFKENGICAIPGVGFDVVPSDCQAAFVAKQLPDATHLNLYIYSKGGVSRGTSLTMVENIDKGGAIRKDGRIKVVRAAYKSLEVTFGDKKKKCVTIPWGDVSTAFHSTGIPNIEVYMSLPASAMKMLSIKKRFGFIFKLGFVKNFMRRKVMEGKAGPSEKSREKSEVNIIAEAINASGKSVRSYLNGPDGYNLTAMTALESVIRVTNDNPKPGFYTPSTLFGADYILEFDGIVRKEI